MIFRDVAGLSLGRFSKKRIGCSLLGTRFVVYFTTFLPPIMYIPLGRADGSVPRGRPCRS